MNIGILGTGVVARTIGSKLTTLGHAVKLGSRNAEHPGGQEWARGIGERASVGTFADAAGFGELVFNCTSGTGSLPALSAARAQLEGKLLLDVTNPLETSPGKPPVLFTGSTDSLGEMAQRELPNTLVVKTLNTVNCELMVDARSVADGEHHMFVAGNDAGAKARATELLQTWFGWKHVLDLGDISAARGMESYISLWVRLFGSQRTSGFNIRVVR